MELDCEICLCFHVTRRKLLRFVRVEQPVVASQMAQCGGAGTGCGWCVPFVQQIFEEVRGHSVPKEEPIDSNEYRRRRDEYLRSRKTTSPPVRLATAPIRESDHTPE